jgi:hypothetical protein
MRTGVEAGVVAEPTAEIIDTDGMPAQLTRIRAERPAHIPAGPPRVSQGFEFDARPSPMPQPFIPQGTLQYDFPLLPGVQCRVVFQGDVTADHLEQLLDYLGVACKRLREQEARPKRIVEKVDAKPKGRKAHKGKDAEGEA